MNIGLHIEYIFCLKMYCIIFYISIIKYQNLFPRNAYSKLINFNKSYFLLFINIVFCDTSDSLSCLHFDMSVKRTEHVCVCLLLLCLALEFSFQFICNIPL